MIFPEENEEKRPEKTQACREGDGALITKKRGGSITTKARSNGRWKKKLTGIRTYGRLRSSPGVGKDEVGSFDRGIVTNKARGKH